MTPDRFEENFIIHDHEADCMRRFTPELCCAGRSRYPQITVMYWALQRRYMNRRIRRSF